MSTVTKCDICKYDIGREVRYEVARYDQTGYFDHLDICSPACLARSAVSDSHTLGELAEAVAVQSKLAGAPIKVRKWWNR